jgi:hypothetical protein
LKRVVAVVLALVFVCAACGSSESSDSELGGNDAPLSDDAKHWCQRNRDLHGEVGIELGEAGQPGVTEDFSPDDFEYRSFEFYWSGDAGWDRACQEAYERFGDSG